ncbi:TPA: family 78 glycoside hydrolase catalytic domain [Streptococcus suis]|nr:family 78 glycoside hydrolase catalytic domain [Streptococcus suis]HEM5991365.1 family 78 glycoside hydrolase catalytic domain [Streptococcus suis]HEM6196974.1 family 78 glycoside hydrolase catalytic domain [Streptococcus suis]HEP1779658.1 family 78 glycoside hydrolase catalytic domain [Streptococcus suis]HEP1781772.1 family 78 glycoside hydrolase catalytic domain [Streptococcus suis]
MVDKQSPFGEAKWISRLGNPLKKEAQFFTPEPNMVFTKEILIKEEVKDARVFIRGLGYYVLYINDVKVSNDVLLGDLSNFDKRVYYDTFNISGYIRQGKNTIRVEVGNGWYNPAPLLILGKYNIRKQLAVGHPGLIANVIVKTDNNVLQFPTDKNWASGAGQYIQNDLYVGESYIDDDSYKKDSYQTVEVFGPAGKLEESTIPKIKQQYALSPIKLKDSSVGKIFDFGQIISGQIQLEIPAECIGNIRLTYAERLTESGEMDYSSTISGRYGLKDTLNVISEDSPIIQMDNIIKRKQEPLLFENTFTYHSFRYVQIQFLEGDFEIEPSQFTAHAVNTSVRQIVSFKSSNHILNQIWEAGMQTRANNIHSYFEDCTRERFGYGGDIVALLTSHQATTDIESLLKKVIVDFADCQQNDGGIPQTAPYVGIMTNGTSNGAGSLGWQLVFPRLATTLVKDYGQSSFVKKLSLELDKHLNYLLSFDSDYIRLCCLGDWGAIDEVIEDGIIKSPDQEFCSSIMYYILLTEYMKLIELDICSFSYSVQLEERILEMADVLSTYYKNSEGYYASGTMSSSIFAIKACITSDAVSEMLLSRIIQQIEEQDGVFSVGIFGMSWLYEELANIGRNDLIYQWLTRKEAPSFSYMLRKGNKTLSEHFEIPSEQATYSGSLNHAMFSSFSAWYVHHLIGVKINNEQIQIQTDLNLPVEKIEAQFETNWGTLYFKKASENIELSGPNHVLTRLKIIPNLREFVTILDIDKER